MSWLNPWYWWQTPEDKEDDKPVEPVEKKHMYQVTEGVEIDTSKIWLCDELLALKKQSLNPVAPTRPPTPEKDKIEQKLKFHKKKLRKKKNYKRRRFEKNDFPVN